MIKSLSRRSFLGQTGRGAAAAGLAFASAGALDVRRTLAQSGSRARPNSPNDRISIGLIGCGGQGTGDMMDALGQPDVQVLAVCDVDETHSAAAAQQVEARTSRRPDSYKDFRKLLERKDIDAVIIGTPDHWHALPVIMACEAGKDIYCEKPISHDITEALSMDGAVKRFARVVQVGTWQRSTSEFLSAMDYVRSGKLGKVTTVRAWKTDDYHMGHQQPGTPPATFDYDFWVGPAAFRPYIAGETHFQWRWFFDFGAGMTGDWGVHMMDIGLLGMSPTTDLVMPVEVSSVGGKLAWPDDDRTTPDTLISVMRFRDPDFVMQWETGRRGLDNGPDHGTEFIAADGKSVMVWRGGWVVKDRDGKELPREELPGSSHMRNWLDCIRTRQQPRSNLASMAQTTIVCHLANASYLAGESVVWDKTRMDIVGRAGKDTQSYRREYRKPWKLPIYRV